MWLCADDEASQILNDYELIVRFYVRSKPFPFRFVQHAGWTNQRQLQPDDEKTGTKKSIKDLPVHEVTVRL